MNFLCRFRYVIKLYMRFFRNHVFEVAVVQNSDINNPIDLKYDMHV